MSSESLFKINENDKIEENKQISDFKHSGMKLRIKKGVQGVKKDDKDQ